MIGQKGMGRLLLAIIAHSSIRQMVVNGGFIREIHLDLHEQIWPLVCRLIHSKATWPWTKVTACKKAYNTTLLRNWGVVCSGYATDVNNCLLSRTILGGLRRGRTVINIH